MGASYSVKNDKDTWLADRGLDNLEWPISEVPDGIHLDNPKEFHSHALVRGAQEYGIELTYRPMGRPHYGGHIERLIGTTMERFICCQVHLLERSKKKVRTIRQRRQR